MKSLTKGGNDTNEKDNYTHYSHIMLYTCDDTIYWFL